MALLNDGRQFVNVSANKTLTAADQGIVQNVVANGVTITLPGTKAGYSFTVRNGGLAPAGAPAGAVSDKALGLTVAVAAADALAGNGFAALDGKGAVNAATGSFIGDEITVVGDGDTGTVANVGGYNLASVRGAWTRVA